MLVDFRPARGRIFRSPVPCDGESTRLATIVGVVPSEHTPRASALAIQLGILLDGIPEPIVIDGSAVEGHVSFSLIAGLFLSNYPDELSNSVGMCQQGMHFAWVIFTWTSLMVLTGIGAALGRESFVGANPHAFAVVEGVSATTAATACRSSTS